jgi:hypothetical protein
MTKKIQINIFGIILNNIVNIFPSLNKKYFTFNSQKRQICTMC